MSRNNKNVVSINQLFSDERLRPNLNKPLVKKSAVPSGSRLLQVFSTAYKKEKKECEDFDKFCDAVAGKIADSTTALLNDLGQIRVIPESFSCCINTAARRPELFINGTDGGVSVCAFSDGVYAYSAILEADTSVEGHAFSVHAERVHMETGEMQAFAPNKVWVTISGPSDSEEYDEGNFSWVDPDIYEAATDGQKLVLLRSEYDDLETSLLLAFIDANGGPVSDKEYEACKTDHLHELLLCGTDEISSYRNTDGTVSLCGDRGFRYGYAVRKKGEEYMVYQYFDNLDLLYIDPLSDDGNCSTLYERYVGSTKHVYALSELVCGSKQAHEDSVVAAIPLSPDMAVFVDETDGLTSDTLRAAVRDQAWRALTDRERENLNAVCEFLDSFAKRANK